MDENEWLVTVSRSRFEELIRAEQTAQQLTSIIANKHEHYGTIDRDDIRMLYDLFCPKKEEED